MGQEELKVPEQSPMYWALRKERYTRQEYISKIQEITGRRLLVYFSTNKGSISLEDIQGFSDLLERLEGKYNDIDLLLQTTGGDIDVAEKIVYMCWEKAKSFRVIVAERAKSAGTLIALAADEIVMGYASELGPIDPQIFVPQTGETLPVAKAYLTMVALNNEGRPTPVPQLVPGTEEARKKYQQAKSRREERLRRMKLNTDD